MEISILEVSETEITYAKEVTTLTKVEIEGELDVLASQITELENLASETEEELVERLKKEMEEALITHRLQKEESERLLQEKKGRKALLEALHHEILAQVPKKEEIGSCENVE